MIFLTVLCFLTIMPSIASFKDLEVAVIIGGINIDNDNITEVEVYNFDKDGYEITCPGLGANAPQVPSFPIPLFGASAIYLPNIGIYVCGGAIGQLNCYKYNPRISRRYYKYNLKSKY